MKLEITRSFGILSKLKHFRENALLKLYWALIHSHLNYVQLVWGNTHSAYHNNIEVVQNNAMCIITGSS